MAKGRSEKGQTVTLYKYVSVNHLKDILENQHLILNDGKTFNDPFEVCVTDRKSKEVKHVDGLHILSLTNTFQNKLMWSHYTNSHEGVCLSVEVPKRMVYPLCYTGERVFSDSNLSNIVSKRKRYAKKNLEHEYDKLSDEKIIAHIKDKKWLYELEYRIVLDKEDESTEKELLETKSSEKTNEKKDWFIKVKIKNIYLGIRFNKEKQSDILGICKKKGILVKQMTLNGENYGVEYRKK